MATIGNELELPATTKVLKSGESCKPGRETSAVWALLEGTLPAWAATGIIARNTYTSYPGGPYARCA